MPSRSIAVIKKTLEQIGISTEFVYRPLDPNPERNVFNDWELLISRYEVIDAPKIIFVDIPSAQTINLPDIGRPYDFSDTAIIGLNGKANMVFHPNTEIVASTGNSGFFYFAENIELEFQSSGTNLLNLEDDITLNLTLRSANIRNNGSTNNVIRVNNSLSAVEIDLVDGSNIETGASEVFELNNATSTVQVLDQSTIQTDSFRGSGTISVERDSSTTVSSTQTNVTGAFNISTIGSTAPTEPFSFTNIFHVDSGTGDATATNGVYDTIANCIANGLTPIAASLNNTPGFGALVLLYTNDASGFILNTNQTIIRSANNAQITASIQVQAPTPAAGVGGPSFENIAFTSGVSINSPGTQTVLFDGCTIGSSVSTSGSNGMILNDCVLAGAVTHSGTGTMLLQDCLSFGSTTITVNSTAVAGQTIIKDCTFIGVTLDFDQISSVVSGTFTSCTLQGISAAPFTFNNVTLFNLTIPDNAGANTIGGIFHNCSLLSGLTIEQSASGGFEFTSMDINGLTFTATFSGTARFSNCTDGGGNSNLAGAGLTDTYAAAMDAVTNPF